MKLFKNEKNKYLVVFVILCLLFLVGCGATQYYDAASTEENPTKFLLPIAHGLYGETLDFLVYPMAWLLFNIAKIVNYNYAIAILITTVLIRAIAWPIYGKTNDMQMKMNLLSPELQKIEKKYAGKDDKESQQRKSMETMQLYKKYKVSFSGCLMPFIQMPIFLAFYETLRRIPYTCSSFLATVSGTFTNGKNTISLVPNESGSALLYDADLLNTNILGLDLSKTASESTGWGKWGIYVLALLVVATQLGMQIISQRRSKKARNDMQSDVPDYRKSGQTEQQKQSESMMKVMMYMMPIMMGIFVIQSTAALGWYWLVGNLFTAFQTYISAKNSEKKMLKLKEKYNSSTNLY